MEKKLLSESERIRALDNAYAIIRRNLKEFTYFCQSEAGKDGFYYPIDNVEWTTGFWPGELWLIYEYSKDEEIKKVAQIFTESFRKRIDNKIAVDHHDMGFLYTPSCVYDYMLTQSAGARDAAIKAADQLLRRWQEKGQFLQAWGAFGAKENYRYIIDCLLNLPLLYWASDETGDEKYRKTALLHTATCMANSFRSDNSTFHTFFMDPDTGAPVRGETCQGYKADSSWARGQAWGVYGMALSYRHTKEMKYLDKFEAVLDYFLSKLPDDKIPYWDLIFTSGDEPRDSSSASIVACGCLEAAESYEKLNMYEKSVKYKMIAKELLKAVYDTCMTDKDDMSTNGLIKHGTYSKKSPYNTCTENGVDEPVSWGDYYWLEALMRLSGEWKCIW